MYICMCFGDIFINLKTGNSLNIFFILYLICHFGFNLTTLKMIPVLKYFLRHSALYIWISFEYIIKRMINEIANIAFNLVKINVKIRPYTDFSSFKYVKIMMISCRCISWCSNARALIRTILVITSNSKSNLRKYLTDPENSLNWYNFFICRLIEIKRTLNV